MAFIERLTREELTETKVKIESAIAAMRGSLADTSDIASASPAWVKLTTKLNETAIVLEDHRAQVMAQLAKEKS